MKNWTKLINTHYYYYYYYSLHPPHSFLNGTTLIYIRRKTLSQEYYYTIINSYFSSINLETSLLYGTLIILLLSVCYLCLVAYPNFLVLQ